MRRFRCERTGVFSGADASVDAFGPVGVAKSDTRTLDEWLCACDSGFLPVVRLENSRCGWVIVRTLQCGIEVAVPFCAMRSVVPDAVGLELSPKPGFHSGASGDSVAVNLVGLLGDSAVRFESFEEVPAGFMVLDVDGCLPVPWPHLTPP